MSSSSLPYAQHPHSLFAPVVPQTPTCLVAGRARSHTCPTTYDDSSCYYAHQAYPLPPDLAFNAQYYTQEFTPTQFLYQSPTSESTLIQAHPCDDQTLSSHPTLDHLQHSYYVASAGTIQEPSQNQPFHWDFSSCDSYSSSLSPSVVPPSDTLLYAQSPHPYQSPHEVQDTSQYTQPLAQAPVPSGEEPYPYPRTPSTYHIYCDPGQDSGSKQQRQQQEPSDNQKNNEHDDVDKHHTTGSALHSKNAPHGSSCSSPTRLSVSTSSSPANFTHISTPTSTPGQETMIASPHSPHHLNQHNLDSHIMTQSPVTQSNFSELSVDVTFINQMSHFHPSNHVTFGGVRAPTQFEGSLPHRFTQELTLAHPPTSSPSHFTNGFSPRSSPTHMTSLMDSVSLNASPMSPTVAPAPRYPPSQAIVPNQFTHDATASPHDNSPFIGRGGGSLFNGSGLALGLDSRVALDVRRTPTVASVMTSSPLVPPISSSGRRHRHLSGPVPLSHGLSLSAGVPRLSQRGNLGAIRNVRRGSAFSGHTMSLAVGLPSSAAEGKKQTLACLFCRERKIACGRPNEGSLDPTCNQCARRSLRCEYPTESRRGQHKRSKKKQHAVA